LVDRIGEAVSSGPGAAGSDSREPERAHGPAAAGEGRGAEIPAPVASLVDAVRAMVPVDVALVVDDAHRCSAAGLATLAGLVDALPTNGHLVVASRAYLDLPVARWTASGEAVVLGEDALAFDDLELAQCGIDPDLAVHEWVRLGWPALVGLHVNDAASAIDGYLRREVLAGVAHPRRTVLAALAGLGPMDGDLVRAATDGEITGLEDLVAGLPLVAGHAGSVEVPAGWGRVIDHDQPGEEAAVCARVGGLLRSRGELARAAAAFARAGREDELVEVIRSFAQRPTMHTDVWEVTAILDVLPVDLRSGGASRYLEAARYWASDERLARGLFAGVAERCRAEGDVELEALARWRLVQHDDLDAPAGTGAVRHLDELARIDHPIAASAAGWARLRAAIGRGEPDGAVDALAHLDAFAPAQRANLVAICMIDVGRPEAVPTSLERVLDAGLADIYEAQAVWLQGAIDPSVAWPIARALVDRADGQSLTVRVSLLSVLATMALSGGDPSSARELTEEAARSAAAVPHTVAGFARVAAALVALDASEDAGVAALRSVLHDLPLDRWPERPHLYALAALRALLPEAEHLDRCRFGPSLTVAVAAGAAVAAGRRGDPAPARALPWAEPALLRVHVPPCLLVELAVVADRPEARVVLENIPDAHRHLQRIEARPGHPARPVAGRMLASRPVHPGYTLELRALGCFELQRSDGVPTTGWDRRARVRELLAYLLVHGESARAEIAATLWPDLPTDRAGANLRVNLSHLATALQPDRDPGAPAWFVVTDGVRVRLADGQIRTDVAEADAALAAAVRAEADGLPTEAVTHYRSVVERYGGALLPGLDAWWVEGERARLQSCAHVATVRLGELTLARGEPEEALALAAAASRLDLLSERSRCLAAAAHLALGSLDAARSEVAIGLRMLADAGMVPSAELGRLARRLGLAS
jgi:DNA-binding SARP family transcriptional activator